MVTRITEELDQYQIKKKPRGMPLIGFLGDQGNNVGHVEQKLYLKKS
ncbi:MAG: hypothetical protein WKF36_10080 [Candidatus Nitrosocosmicus sp.]